MDREKLGNKIHNLKLALTLSSVLGGSTMTAAAPNTSSQDAFSAKTEVLTKHLDGNVGQKYIQTMSQGTKCNQSVEQTLTDLGDGYFMVSSNSARLEVNNNKNQTTKSDVLYMATPEGKVYDCSFIKAKEGGSLLPYGFEKGFFVKEDGSVDKDTEAKTISEVKQAVDADRIDAEVTERYNDKVISNKMNIAKEKGFSDKAAEKLGVYMNMEKETLESGKTYVASFTNEVLAYSNNQKTY